MTTRVMLISPAVGPDLREARFGGDGGLDAPGVRRARAAARLLPAARHVAVSPTGRCRETAEALGLGGAFPNLPGSSSGVCDVRAPAGLDVGRWRGRTLDEVAAEEPAAVAEWLAEPDAAPHGGESVAALRARVGGWLDAAAAVPGRMIAVVEPDVVRAAVVHALGAGDGVFWRVDAVALGVVELSGHVGRWNLRVGAELGRYHEVQGAG